jgi:large conductance mechanosensitive channel
MAPVGKRNVFSWLLTKQNERIMLSELKAFLLRGDVLALAVAVIIGGAFQKIVDSLVADIITPVIGLIGGTPDFSGLKIADSIMIGNFINALISFITIGMVLFFLVKAAGKKAE